MSANSTVRQPITPQPARPDLRVEAWGHADDVERYDSDWRSYPHHLIVYAAQGVVHLQVGDADMLLPPQRAAFIAAGTEHRLHNDEPVSLRSVFFAPGMCEAPPVPCAIFEVNALAREMIVSSGRWTADRDATDERATRFFLALAAMVPEWVEQAQRFRLPLARSPELGRAMQYALEHLNEEPTIEDAAKLAGVSARTLARRFQEEADTTWRKFLHDARMMKAMELLADRSRSVTDTAYAVGFSSLGAFTRAFVDFTGERPRDYHRRITNPGE